MIEQKLFFTRNGEYTIWEKVDSLKECELDQLLIFIEKDREINIVEDIVYKKRIIYEILDSEDDRIKDALEAEVDKYFLLENRDKCDFNAILHRIKTDCVDIDVAYKELQKLKSMNNDYEIDGINTSIFLRKENMCIDIRISSKKINVYKDNSNEQIINTEVRIYFVTGLILITDYGDYTHNKKVKDKLLENIYNLLNDNYKNNTSYRMSDITLRRLLKKSDKYASKFTFYIDDYINVDFNVVEDMGGNPLEHSGLREFYEKHPIRSIKIAMNSDVDKYITIDGEKGKLISRYKKMEVKDVDEFVNVLNEVIKYDYLNFDYKKDIRRIAIEKRTGHTASKVSYVNDLYKEIENKIVLYLGEKNDIDIVYFTRNTFFYCLINKFIYIGEKVSEYSLGYKIIRELNRWFKIGEDNIEVLFSNLIKIAIDSDEDLLECFDSFINSKGDLNVNQV